MAGCKVAEERKLKLISLTPNDLPVCCYNIAAADDDGVLW